MKIPVYEQEKVGPSAGGAAYSLPGERSGPLTIPRQRDAWSGITDFAEKVTRIGDRMMEASRVEEFSNALVAADDEYANLLHRINTDPKVRESSPEEHEVYYRGEMAKIKARISKPMKSARARDAFGFKFDEKAIDGRIKVRAIGRQRFISKGRASTDEQLDSLVNNLAETGDWKTVSEGHAIIEGKVAAGFFSPEEGRQLFERFDANATLGYWQRRILDNPVAAWDELQKDPPSLANLQAAAKTALMAKAKAAAKTEGREERRAAIYAEMQIKFGTDWDKKVDWMENPKHYPGLDLESRRYLIATWQAEKSRDLAAFDRYRNEMARKDHDAAIAHFRTGDYGKILEITEKSEFMSPQIKSLLYTAAIRGQSADRTVPAVYAHVARAIHKGHIKTRDQLDAYRLNGLSNVDADKLTGKLDKPKYKATMDWAEGLFKRKYPAKDDLEMYNKYYEFLNYIDRQFELAEEKKGAELTSEETRKIVESELDEQIEQRYLFGIEWDPLGIGFKPFDLLWPDVKFRPWEKHLEGKKAAGTEELERQDVHDVPKDVQPKIANHLIRNGYKPSPENIANYYFRNPDKFYKAHREDKR